MARAESAAGALEAHFLLRRKPRGQRLAEIVELKLEHRSGPPVGAPFATVLHVAHRILVPVDYSEGSAAALALAAALAPKLGASLDVVHVWDRPAYVAETIVVGPPDQKRPLTELIRENAEGEMRDFIRRAALPSGLEVETRLLSGNPAGKILEELGSGRHELLVVGTHGRTGLRHLLLGSVAEKLVRLSPVPVLTVPTPHAAR